MTGLRHSLHPHLSIALMGLDAEEILSKLEQFRVDEITFREFIYPCALGAILNFLTTTTTTTIVIISKTEEK